MRWREQWCASLPWEGVNRHRGHGVVWALLGIPLLHVMLLPLVLFAALVPASLVAVLRPLGMAGALALVVYAAQAQRGIRRWAWMWEAASISLSIVFTLLRIIPELPITDPLLQMLPIPIYLCAILSMAFYLWPQSWSHSLINVVRITIDTISVGYGAFFVLQFGLPLLLGDVLWNATTRTVLTYVALDIAVFFGLGVIRLRYHLPASRFLSLVFICFLALIAADSLYFLALWGSLPSTFLESHVHWPLYTLYSITLGLAAYVDVHDGKPQDRGDAIAWSEWLLWTFAPLMFVIAAFVVLALSKDISVLFVLILVSISIAHQISAALDYYRLLQHLRTARVSMQRAFEREAQARHLVRAVQHELRGHTRTLTGVVAGLHTIAQDTPGFSPRTAALLRILQRNVGTLDDLVQQLLLLSQGDEPAPRPHTPLVLWPLLAQVVETVKQNLPRPEITFHIVAPPDLVLIADPLQLSLALRTALHNAIQAIDTWETPAATITLQALRDGSSVCIRVSDTGPGFAPDVLALLHAQQHATGFVPGISSRDEGHGLGLAVLDQVAHRHGGTFAFGNNATDGAWVELRLPSLVQPGATSPDAA